MTHPWIVERSLCESDGRCSRYPNDANLPLLPLLPIWVVFDEGVSATPAALQALERLYDEMEAHQELADILLRRAAIEPDAQSRRTLLARAGLLFENSLEEADRAVDVWREVLALFDDDSDAMDALERLFLSLERWRDLIDILYRRADLALDGQAVMAALDAGPGRHVGQALTHLAHFIADRPESNNPEALETELFDWARKNTNLLD